jgi:hypothetical protein
MTGNDYRPRMHQSGAKVGEHEEQHGRHTQPVGGQRPGQAGVPGLVSGRTW